MKGPVVETRVAKSEPKGKRKTRVTGTRAGQRPI
jgi:hypothetical protein